MERLTRARNGRCSRTAVELLAAHAESDAMLATWGLALGTTRGGETWPADLLEYARHVSACSRCRSRFEALRLAGLAVPAAETPAHDVRRHPARIELENHVLGRVDPRRQRALEAHLATCPACDGEARYLRGLSGAVDRAREAVHTIGDATHAPTAADADWARAGRGRFKIVRRIEAHEPAAQPTRAPAQRITARGLQVRMQPTVRVTAALVAHPKDAKRRLAKTGRWKRELTAQEDPSRLLTCGIHRDDLFEVRLVEAWEAEFSSRLSAPTTADFEHLGPSSVIVSVVARESDHQHAMDLRDRVTIVTGRDAPARFVDEAQVQSFVLPVDTDGRVELAVSTPDGPTRLVLEFVRPPAAG
jgi:anti-sigma factor RsiW